MLPIDLRALIRGCYFEPIKLFLSLLSRVLEAGDEMVPLLGSHMCLAPNPIVLDIAILCIWCIF